MTGPPYFIALMSFIISVQPSPTEVRQTGRLAWEFNKLTNELTFVAGGGVLIGLGLGITVSGAIVYVYKRKQINARFHP